MRGFLFWCLVLSSQVERVHGGLVGTRFVEALAHVESGGNPEAIGDGGRAIGLYQLHRGTWNLISAIRQRRGLPTYPYVYATDRVVSTQYVDSYFEHYERVYAERSGGTPLTDTQRLLIWQLGYRGAVLISFDINRAPAHNRRANHRLHNYLSTHGK